MICPDCDDEVHFRTADGRGTLTGIVIGVDPAGLAAVLVGSERHVVRFERIIAAVRFGAAQDGPHG